MAFPLNFLFGTANADHQVEAHDPRHEDVWDLWERTQGLSPRGRATDFWNRYEEDIAAAAAMGCKLFRFSTAWARVETSEGVFDPEALAHYRRVAECVRSHGMQVMLTLHHFVWPVWLERDHGGMLGKRFPDLFARYADRVAEAMGGLVDYWITFNEPSQLTFGYIKPWWRNRYYMPPGLPRGEEVDEEAAAVGRLVPSLFRAHARARVKIKARRSETKVGVNPLVTGFPTWLQMLMDWAACHRRLSEALFKFTTRGALVGERAKVDLVIGGITSGRHGRFESSDPYLRTGKAVLVKADWAGEGMDSLADKRVGVLGIGNQPDGWKRDLPPSAKKRIFSNYDEARSSLAVGAVDAVYGDAPFLMPHGLEESGSFRFLVTGLSDESYVVLAPNGHGDLLERVNRVVATFQREVTAGREEPWIQPAAPSDEGKLPPVSLAEVLWGPAENERPGEGRGRSMKHIRRRGRIRIGLRKDTPGLSPACRGEGLELLLARRIAHQVMGDEDLLEIVPLEPSRRAKALSSKSSWLNWAWRFWGTTSLIANANWWYLGTSGRLPVELCPDEAIGAQDFVGLDYYWGLPTHKLHRFRSLEDAAHGKFIQAPVWPQGLFHALRRFHRWFPGQELFIVENGSVPEANGVPRGEYLKLHLQQVEKAIDKGVPVSGYNCWSITSNREWGHPFDPNTDFGLYFVDMDKDPELRRVETAEVEVYREIIAAATTRGV
ncbi:family 1 glycosylhydrolase [Luteolibacter ambystomatis]|uniref:Family 1 glycosylhydrolase n=1 Tax=Luteolibacter ambystomatis TaxID=2824561 RepID=A0A975J2L8_9BACT|nr:family 1 glycosylhydrolase [Luteolibacter ambystomatis]QUE52849.1 family 1 glycosylhydrolase [Luteolibacter ambystomatis]